MRNAKFFTIFVFTTLLAYGALGLYFLPLASFQSDLTRMGMMPESQFGWRKPQPEIDQQWLAQASMQEADVLVIGDSFSIGHVWQTILTRQGFRVRTVHWDSMHAICADFMPWLKSQGFHGQFVVLQHIERNIESRLGESVACQITQTNANVPAEVSADTPRFPPSVSSDSTRQDRSGRLSVGIQTALNFGEYLRLSGTPGFKSKALANGTRVARVNNGCELFSHASCYDSLFLAEDKAEDIPDSALDYIEKLNGRMVGVTPIWLFVPNKSTAYLYPDKQFWNKAERRFHAPNLLRMTRQARQTKTIDLYPANNTHFSTTGYLLMGEEVLKTLRTARAR